MVRRKREAIRRENTKKEVNRWELRVGRRRREQKKGNNMKMLWRK